MTTRSPGPHPQTAPPTADLPARQTICLCMIVKNESHVIRRCLDSVRPLLDHWVIVDTGSTDGTQQAVREHLHDVPGELFERPWVDFAHNRNEALALARGRADYLLILDADEVLERTSGFYLPPLTADAYSLTVHSGSLAFHKTQLVRDAAPLHFRGVVHEYLYAGPGCRLEYLAGMTTLRIPDGARSRDPLTYRRDALLLEGELLRQPEDPRTLFYLAQSYADAREPELAIDRYQKRIALGGWAEEVWYSLYQVARLMPLTGAEWPATLAAYLAAFAFRPQRAEPLFHIGACYQARQEFALAHLFYAHAVQLPYPAGDMLFVDKAIYDLLLPLEYAVTCFYVGRHRPAIETADRLLRDPHLTPEMREQILRNRQFSLDALAAADALEVPT